MSLKGKCTLGDLVEGDMFTFDNFPITPYEKQVQYVCLPYPEEFQHYYCATSFMVRNLARDSVEVYSKANPVVHIGTPADYLLYLLSQE